MKEIGEKLQKTYVGRGNNMRVFHIKQEIDAIWQRDRMIQEYAIELERL